MFQGTTIEELINSVVRAEDHAREQEKIRLRRWSANIHCAALNGARKWLR
jgi:hypothetical protein